MSRVGQAIACRNFLPRLNDGDKTPEHAILCECHEYGPVYNNSRCVWSVIGLRKRQAIACPTGLWGRR